MYTLTPMENLEFLDRIPLPMLKRVQKGRGNGILSSSQFYGHGYIIVTLTNLQILTQNLLYEQDEACIMGRFGREEVK